MIKGMWTVHGQTNGSKSKRRESSDYMRHHDLTFKGRVLNQGNSGYFSLIFESRTVLAYTIFITTPMQATNKRKNKPPKQKANLHKQV